VGDRFVTHFDHPVLSPSELAHLALRYAADDLTAPDLQAFEARLCDDQAAREAVAEAIRLSAAAIGTVAPTPDANLARDIAEQVNPTWLSRLLPRQRYRGHPGLWATAGALAVGSIVVLLGAGSKSNEESASRQMVLVQQPSLPEVSAEPVVITRRESTEFPNSKLNPMGWHEKHPNAATPMPMEPVAVGRVKERNILQPTNKPDIAESGHSSDTTQPMPKTETDTKKL
jgi:hypothetical protein